VDILRAGRLMGKITASGLYAPSIIGVLQSAYSKSGSGNTSMTVSAAQATELVRRVGSTGTFQICGPPSANGTVATEQITYSAVNTTTGVITITAASANFAAGSWVQPEDGSETIRTFLDVEAGIKVTDQDDNDVDQQWGKVPIAGVIDQSQIINWGTDTSLQARIQTQLRDMGIGFVFDGDF
jgi:hypothetical protein